MDKTVIFELKMNIRQVTILLFSFFLFVNGFSQKISLPKDFEIEFQFCGNNFNSAKTSFTKLFSSGDSVEVKLRLTKKEKLQIFSLLEKNDFFDYPTHYKCSFNEGDGFSTATPCCSYCLTAYQKDGSKTVSWSQCEKFNPDDEKFKKLMTIYEEILKIIINKKQYKNLPHDKIERL